MDQMSLTSCRNKNHLYPAWEAWALGTKKERRFSLGPDELELPLAYVGAGDPGGSWL